MIEKQYFTRQAVTALKLAQTTSDCQMAAALIVKAADLQSHHLEDFLDEKSRHRVESVTAFDAQITRD